MNHATTTSYWGKLYQQTNGGYKKTKNIYVGSQLVATIEKQGTAAVIPYYVLSDNLSSVTMLTNSAGVATQTLDYLPFGGVRVNSKNTSFDSQRKYIGQLMDSSTNLDYLNARYYDGNRGQFTSQDPLSRNIGLNPTDRLLLNPQEQNMYSYALNNPIKLSDPSGEAVSAQQLNLQIQIAQLQVQVLQLTQQLYSMGATGAGNNAYTAYQSTISGAGMSAFPGINKPEVKVPDISQRFTGLLRSALHIAPSFRNDPVSFANYVRPGGMGDLKNSDIYPEFDPRKNKNGFMLYGQHVRSDAPGNIYYGFLGSAAGYSEKTLNTGAGAAQVISDNASHALSPITKVPNTNWNFHGDNSGDTSYILQGINLYMSIPSW